MMFSNDPRSIFPEGVFVLSCNALHEEAGAPRAAAAVSPGESDPQAQDRAEAYGLTPAGTRVARWALLQPDDRKVFNTWARWVAVFYSVIVVSLLAAILLGNHTSVGQQTLYASPVTERGAAESPPPGSIRK
jgi:hypothetical protein